jgi:hypothetical protein
VENSHDEKTAHVRSYQTGFESEMRVSFSVFHDDQTYPPNYARYPRVHLPWR